VIEYAKANQDDILARITLINRGLQAADCVALPSQWFRNTWSWGYENGPMNEVPGRPHLKQIQGTSGLAAVEIKSPAAGTYNLFAENPDDLLFTNNETNFARIDHSRNGNPYVKDAFHRYLVNGDKDAVNPAREGTKVAALFSGDIDPGTSRTIRLRLAATRHEKPFAEFDTIISQRMTEADEFYDAIQKPGLSEDEKRAQRHALAGMLWTKQFFYYNSKERPTVNFWREFFISCCYSGCHKYVPFEPLQNKEVLITFPGKSNLRQPLCYLFYAKKRILFENTVCVPTHETALHYPKPQRAAKEDIKPSPRVDGYLFAIGCTDIQAD